MTEHELELAELVRLEPAGGLEPFPEGLELERRHGLEDVQLRDEHLQDGEDALHRVLDPRGVAGIQPPDHLIDLVEDLLEPQLVDLVDDDEEHLVVLGTRGSGALEREELVDGQVAAVGHGSIGHADSLPEEGRVQGCRGAGVQGCGCRVRGAGVQGCKGARVQRCSAGSGAVRSVAVLRFAELY